MLKLGLYAINDEASKAFFNPFVARTHEEAIRSFGDNVKNPESNLAKHPKDFALYHIGFFDQVQGLIESTETSIPERISRASDFAQAEKK